MVVIEVSGVEFTANAMLEQDFFRHRKPASTSIESNKDRNSISLVRKSWYRSERLSRARVFVENCYAISPEKVVARFPGLNSLNLKGKPHFSDFNLVPRDWGGFVFPCIEALAKGRINVEELRLKRMVVSDESIELISRSFANFKSLAKVVSDSKLCIIWADEGCLCCALFKVSSDTSAAPSAQFLGMQCFHNDKIKSILNCVPVDASVGQIVKNVVPLKKKREEHMPSKEKSRTKKARRVVAHDDNVRVIHIPEKVGDFCEQPRNMPQEQLLRRTCPENGL